MLVAGTGSQKLEIMATSQVARRVECDPHYNARTASMQAIIAGRAQLIDSTIDWFAERAITVAKAGSGGLTDAVRRSIKPQTRKCSILRRPGRGSRCLHDWNAEYSRLYARQECTKSDFGR